MFPGSVSRAREDRAPLPGGDRFGRTVVITGNEFRLSSLYRFLSMFGHGSRGGVFGAKKERRSITITRSLPSLVIGSPTPLEDIASEKSIFGMQQAAKQKGEGVLSKVWPSSLRVPLNDRSGSLHEEY